NPAELHRQTGGNPFFVTEVLAAGTADIPASVRDAVLARAARLSAAGRATLDAAAVIGARVEPELLVALTGDDAEAIAGCLATGRLPREGDGLAFRHELARQAVQAAIAPHRARALPRQVLTLLRAHDTVDPARLAHHAGAAGDHAAVLLYGPEA